MKNISGIYKITNNVNGKFYIGSSQNISRRWYDHKRELRIQKHHNKYLQRAWNKYGEENFSFEIVEECKVEELSDREQLYIEKYVNSDFCYNISIDTIAPMRGKKTFGRSEAKNVRIQKGINGRTEKSYVWKAFIR